MERLQVAVLVPNLLPFSHRKKLNRTTGGRFIVAVELSVLKQVRLLFRKTLGDWSHS